MSDKQQPAGHEVQGADGQRPQRDRRARPGAARRRRRSGPRPDGAASRSRSGPGAGAVRRDPGPDGSLGDVAWVAAARQSGKLSLLVYQGVLSTELARAADFVLPGSAWVEKDGTFTNDQGRVQGGQGVSAPGEALDDREIFFRVAKARAGAALHHRRRRARGHRRDARRQPGVRRLGSISFARPVTAATGCRPATRPSAGSGTSCSRRSTRRSGMAYRALPQLNIIPLTPVQDGSKGDGR